MNKLFFFLLVLGVIPAMAQDSVADAARASKQKQAVPKKVLTDDDLPSSSSGGSSTSASSADLGAGWDADLNRVRMAYREVCSDPSLHGAKTLPSAKQKQIDEAMAPLRARIAREEDDMKLIKAHMDRLAADEKDEIAAAGSDKQKAAEIHERYEALVKEDKVKVAITMQIAGVVVKEMGSIAAECLQSSKAASTPNGQ